MNEGRADVQQPLGEPLTRRELDVLALLARRLSDREIAERLTLAVSSVKWYTRQIYEKLGVGDRREAVERAGELGLLRRLAPQGPIGPEQLPRAAAPPARRTNLPAPLTSFVGRATELAEVTQAVRRHRLVTLTGAGGLGKTRLATEVGLSLVKSDLDASFPDGVWLVELAALSERALVPQTLARSLKLPEPADRDALDALQGYLADRRLLLILDNCEHLIDACAEIVQHLLRYCWQLHILATSREALGLPGEHLYPVPPLALPDPAQHSAEHVLRSASGRLFLERMESALQSPRRWEDEAAHIELICRQLDGMPLALELAASQVRKVTLAELAGQLNDEMAVLQSRYRAADPRHQTMHNALLWSYQLLNPAAQRLLARVSVFAGGWNLVAAEATCGGEQVLGIRTVLDELVDKSMVLAEDLGGQPRYRLLEPVRQFAQEQLRASGEEPEIRRKHAKYYLEMAEQLHRVRDTLQEQEWLQRLDPERDNLRLVNGWALECLEVEFALSFNGYLYAFWVYHNGPTEARYWLDEALALLPDERSPAILAAEALALDVAGYFVITQHPERAQRYFERELAIYNQTGDPFHIAIALRGCGFAAMAKGDLEQAQAYTARSLIVSQEGADYRGAVWSRFDLGYLAFVQGDLDRARALLTEALPEFRKQGVTIGICRCLAALGHVMKASDELEQARAFYEEALRIEQAVLYADPMREVLEGIAGTYGSAGNPICAARLFGFASKYREATGWGRYPEEEAAYQRDLDVARSRIDPETWTAAWEEGSDMTVEQAIGYALTGPNHYSLDQP